MSSIDTSLPDEITSVTKPRSDHRLSKDVIFELLKNRRRRKVLSYLLDAEETVTLGELAEQIAAWENDTEVTALSSDQRKRVYVALYQTHLPKMADAGIIDYNRDRGLISLSENADLLTMYLDSDTYTQSRWDRIYALFGLVAVGLVAGGYVGIQPLAAIPSLALSLIIVLTLLVVSTVHVIVNRRRQLSIDGKLSRIE